MAYPQRIQVLRRDHIVSSSSTSSRRGNTVFASSINYLYLLNSSASPCNILMILTWCFKINTISLILLSLNFQHGKSDFISDRSETACRELEKLNVSSFMEESQHLVFDFPCGTYRDVDQTICPGKYELVLIWGKCFNQMEITRAVDWKITGASNLKAKSKNLTILFEFEFNRTAEVAFNRTQKYVSGFYFENRDILCIGVNYRWVRFESRSTDLFICEWIAELFAQDGGSKRYFPQEKRICECPLYEDQPDMVLGPKGIWPRTTINYLNKPN